MTSSEEPQNKDKAFNRFKGSTLIAAGLLMLFYPIFSTLGSACYCPGNYRSSLAAVLVPTLFFAYVVALGLTIIIFGLQIHRSGVIPWKTFGPESVGAGFVLGFVLMVVVDFVAYYVFG